MLEHKYNDYLNYFLPENWCAEEDEDILLLYNPNGEGAITISFYNILETQETLTEQISVLAKKFIDQNNILLQSPLVVSRTNESKTILYGTGSTIDDWFIKIWIVAKYPKVVFATYQSEKKTVEIKCCDTIISSFTFKED